MKKKTTKHALFDISRVIFMWMGFMVGGILAAFLLIKVLGPKPNPLIAMFVWIPVMCIVSIIFALPGFGLHMLL